MSSHFQNTNLDIIEADICRAIKLAKPTWRDKIANYFGFKTKDQHTIFRYDFVIINIKSMTAVLANLEKELGVIIALSLKEHWYNTYDAQAINDTILDLIIPGDNISQPSESNNIFSKARTMCGG